jgi:hypothetical protein
LSTWLFSTSLMWMFLVGIKTWGKHFHFVPLPFVHPHVSALDLLVSDLTEPWTSAHKYLYVLTSDYFSFHKIGDHVYPISALSTGIQCVSRTPLDAVVMPLLWCVFLHPATKPAHSWTQAMVSFSSFSWS